MAEEAKGAPPEYDAARVESLLGIVIETAKLPNLSAINGAAMMELVQINGEIQDQLTPPPVVQPLEGKSAA